MSSPNPFPITLVNDSGSSKEIYVVVKGINDSISPTKGQQFYQPITKTWSDSAVSVKLSSLPKSGNNHVLPIPYIDSGIVYLSVGAELSFNGISPPDFSNPSNASFGTTFDKFEISFKKGDGYPYMDITNVDYFCIPLRFSMKLSDKAGTTLGPHGFNKTQSHVFNAFKTGLSSHWSSIIEEDASGNIIRVVAPNKALVEQPPKTHNFDASFFQAYVDKVWSYYAQAGKSVRVDMSEIAPWNPGYNGVVFEGKVSGGKFVFSPVGSAHQSLAKISFSKPSGSNQIKSSLFGCADLFDAPNHTPQSIPAKNLGAAFNVGILADDSLDDVLYLMPSTASKAVSPNGKSWLTYKPKFYSHTMTGTSGSKIECYNAYSAVIHANAIGSDDYGFAFDDVTESDSTLSSSIAASATVTIGKFA